MFPALRSKYDVSSSQYSYYLSIHNIKLQKIHDDFGAKSNMLTLKTTIFKTRNFAGDLKILVKVESSQISAGEPDGITAPKSPEKIDGLQNSLFRGLRSMILRVVLWWIIIPINLYWKLGTMFLFCQWSHMEIALQTKNLIRLCSGLQTIKPTSQSVPGILFFVLNNIYCYKPSLILHKSVKEKYINNDYCVLFPGKHDTFNYFCGVRFDQW